MLIPSAFGSSFRLALRHSQGAETAIFPIQAQLSPQISPRLYRRKLFAERVSCSIALDQKMHFAIDPERPDRRMVQMFPKHADDKIANANMRCLNGFGAELIACYFQTEPFSVELDDRFVGKNQLCCSGDPFRKQLMQREPGRREDHRMKLSTNTMETASISGVIRMPWTFSAAVPSKRAHG